MGASSPMGLLKEQRFDGVFAEKVAEARKIETMRSLP